ncbi:hypothetical protein MMC28_011509 [Mycoblastus sanguinarius]|nr:hypothetical protein [Mycoblastus sanguinarius]
MTNFTTGKWKLLYSEHPEQRQIVEMLQPVGSSVPRLEDKIALRYGLPESLRDASLNQAIIDFGADWDTKDNRTSEHECLKDRRDIKCFVWRLRVNQRIYIINLEQADQYGSTMYVGHSLDLAAGLPFGSVLQLQNHFYRSEIRTFVFPLSLTNILSRVTTEIVYDFRERQTDHVLISINKRSHQELHMALGRALISHYQGREMDVGQYKEVELIGILGQLLAIGDHDVREFIWMLAYDWKLRGNIADYARMAGIPVVA